MEGNYLTEQELKRLPFRSRGLTEFNKLVTEITPYINTSGNQPYKVLEIGCGFGQLLMDLSLLHGNSIQLYGVNLEPGQVDIDRMLRVAKHKKKIPDDYSLNDRQIEFVFCDVGLGIPFPDDYFNLIVSQFAVIYIDQKGFFLEEANRVLRRDGTALLWTGFEHHDFKEGYWSSLQISDGNNDVELSSFFASFPTINYKISSYGSTIVMTKTEKLDLNIRYLSATDLSKPDEKYFGLKSAYRIKKEMII